MVVEVNPINYGGGHERNIRSGTLNVPGIVGISKAVEIAEKEMVSNGSECTSTLIEPSYVLT